MPEVKIGTYMLRGLESVLVYNFIVGQVLEFVYSLVYPSIEQGLCFSALVKCSKELLFVNSCKKFGIRYSPFLTQTYKWTYTFHSLIDSSAVRRLCI